MAIGTTNTYDLHTGDGVEDTFVFTFTVESSADVSLLIDGFETIDATITVNDSLVGGSVVFNTPPSLGADVAIMRKKPVTQEIQVKRSRSLSSTLINAMLDRLIMLVQEAGTRIDRWSVNYTAPPNSESGGVLTSRGDGESPVMSRIPSDQFTRYYSGVIAIPAAGTVVTRAHGLGAKPRFATYALRANKTIDGWAAGTEVPVGMGLATITADATNLYFIRNVTTLGIQNKPNGGTSTANAADWDLVLRAVK